MSKPKPKYIDITAKCSDLCHVQLLSSAKVEIAERDGYVPEFMPGEHYGDYIMLRIDLSTGKIVNWKKPTTEQLNEAFNGNR